MSNQKNCLILAGEKSGEELALSFLPELKNRLPEARFFGVGGEALEREGVEILYHLKDFSSMGFSDVIKKVPFYKKALSHVVKTSVERKIDVAILIDFQDFNLRLARRLSKEGVKVLYYVAPQAWIWKSYRAQVLSRVVHTLFALLPFEKNWFQSRGVQRVVSVKHPLVDQYKKELEIKRSDSISSCPRLLILPGSRHFEVETMLPIFMEVVSLLKKKFSIEIHLVKVSHLDDKFYDPYLKDIDFLYTDQEISKAILNSEICLATSGTVTLTTGLFALPTVVCYKSTLLNEFIFRNFVRYTGPISLTNIILGERVLPEFIQGSVDPKLLEYQLEKWIKNPDDFKQVISKLELTKNLLGGDPISVGEYMAGVIQNG